MTTTYSAQTNNKHTQGVTAAKGRLTILNHKLRVDVLLSNGRLEVLGLKKSEEELVDELEVWPTRLEGWLVLLGVKLRPRRVRGGGKGTECVLCKLSWWERGRQRETEGEGEREREKGREKCHSTEPSSLVLQ